MMKHVVIPHFVLQLYDCKNPRISFKYEDMWYSGTDDEIDVYTQDDNFTTATSCYSPTA